MNANYEFYYKAICPMGVSLFGVASLYTNCNTPKREDPIQDQITKILVNRIDFTNADFRDLVSATEQEIPIDGQ